MDTVRYVRASELAQFIRADLKAAFPRAKFSVTSKSYSMGSSVDIRWTDGPSGQQVDRIVKPYERKTFDGMTDSSGNLGPFVLPTGERVNASSWVHTQRRTTPAAEAHVKAYLSAYWATVVDAEREYRHTMNRACFGPDGGFALVTVKFAGEVQ